MKLGKIKISLEYVVDIENEDMVNHAKNVFYEDIMHMVKYEELYDAIEVVEDDSLTEDMITDFLIETDELSDENE